jgi:hypothetical protein
VFLHSVRGSAAGLLRDGTIFLLRTQKRLARRETTGGIKASCLVVVLAIHYPLYRAVRILIVIDK